MIPIYPRNPDPSRFGNKYKSLLSALSTGIKVYANKLQGFEEILDSSAFYTHPGSDFGCWRILPLKSEEHLLTPEFKDEFPERFDTDSWELYQIFSKSFTLDGFYHKIPRPILKRILWAQEQVPWKPELKQFLESIKPLHRVIGVSVRTWKAPHDTCALSAHRARSFNPQKYIDIINSFEGKVEGVFLSLDNPEVEPLFKDIKIKRIPFTPDPKWPPLVLAAIKAQILGNCGLLIGDRLSTYIEAAWFMGGCKADVILL